MQNLGIFNQHRDIVDWKKVLKQTEVVRDFNSHLKLYPYCVSPTLPAE